MRLGLSKTQLQDSQIQLQEVDKKNFNLSKRVFIVSLFYPPRWESNVAVVSLPVKEITDLRKKLKTAREEGNNAESQKIRGLSATCVPCHSFLHLITKRINTKKAVCLSFFSPALEQTIATQQRANRRLENMNAGLN